MAGFLLLSLKSQKVSFTFEFKKVDYNYLNGTRFPGYVLLDKLLRGKLGAGNTQISESSGVSITNEKVTHVFAIENLESDIINQTV